MSYDSERKYVDLLFPPSNKYPNWNPDDEVRVGDWGYITSRKPGWLLWMRKGGVFVMEGNVYDNELADRYDIPKPTEYGVGMSNEVTWLVSPNAQELDISREITTYIFPDISELLPANQPVYLPSAPPAIAGCSTKVGFRFPSSGGAALAMQNDTLIAIDWPGCLRCVLEDSRMHSCVIISEVHRCSSYACYLSASSNKLIIIGPGDGDTHWAHSATSAAGDSFKMNSCPAGTRIFCPLFQLVSLQDNGRSVNLGTLSERDTVWRWRPVADFLEALTFGHDASSCLGRMVLNTLSGKQ